MNGSGLARPARTAVTVTATVAALFATLLAAGFATLLASPARAASSDSVTKAVEGLRSDKVYVDPGQRALTADQVDKIRQEVESATTPIFLAVLPAAASTAEADQLPKRIHDGLGQPGTYAVLAGRRFSAGSTRLPTGDAMRLAREAATGHPGDIVGGLTEFVNQVDRAAAAGNRESAPASDDNATPFDPVTQPQGSSSESEGSSFAGVFLLILLFGGGALAFLLVRRANRSRVRRQQEELAQVRKVVDEDITAYGEELDRLDFDPSAPGVDDAMRTDYARALDAYEDAKGEIAVIRRAEDVGTVTSALEEGRFALATLAARHEGRPLPERRPPCFFDPRHGPSVQDADWAPAGGMPRQVPVCAADAARLEDGLDPMVREVEVAGGGRRPYWDAGPAYGPWAGGYFGGYGSMLLPGLLVGTLLGSSFGAGDWSGDHADMGGGDWFGGGGDSGGGGDFGGGDFGGGDFGGGDFGGGGDF